MTENGEGEWEGEGRAQMIWWWYASGTNSIGNIVWWQDPFNNRFGTRAIAGNNSCVFHSLLRCKPECSVSSVPGSASIASMWRAFILSIEPGMDKYVDTRARTNKYLAATLTMQTYPPPPPPPLFHVENRGKKFSWEPEKRIKTTTQA